jgi:uncharacterized protein (TIGR04255 family)
MTFPPSLRVVYATHTLNQVICQLRFPTILAIGTEPPTAFQDRVRAEYPLYERQAMPQLAPPIADLLAGLPVKPAGSVVHQFSTADGKRAISLAPEFLSITENDYEEWPDLRREIETAKAALEEIYGPAFYSRIGLRYQDVIDRDGLGLSDRSWSELLNQAFTGLLGVENSSIRDAVTEHWENALVQLDTVEGGVVRIMHGLAKATDDARDLYVIDADYYIDTRQEGGEVLVILDHFREEAGNLFRWAISPVLDAALGRRHVESGVVT